MEDFLKQLEALTDELVESVKPITQYSEMIDKLAEKYPELKTSIYYWAFKKPLSKRKLLRKGKWNSKQK